MKKINLVTILFLMIFVSCSEEGDLKPKPQSNSINKILNLGASRVEGGRPEYESYRYELWKKLKENNYLYSLTAFHISGLLPICFLILSVIEIYSFNNDSSIS